MHTMCERWQRGRMIDHTFLVLNDASCYAAKEREREIFEMIVSNVYHTRDKRRHKCII